MGAVREVWAAALYTALSLLAEGALETPRATPTRIPPSGTFFEATTAPIENSSKNASEPDATARQPAESFTLNKCCAFHEHLSGNTSACVPLGNVTRDALVNATIKERVLWWMDAKVRVAPGGKIETLLALSLNATVYGKKRPCGPELTAISWTGEVFFHLNGSLEMQLLKSAAPGRTESFLLPPEDYCADRTPKNGRLHLVFLACPCRHVVCVRKCCDYTRMLTIGENIAMKQDAHCRERLPSDYKWNAPFTLSAGSERRQANVSYARLRGPFPDTCPSGRTNVIIEMSNKNNTLLSNGTLEAGLTGSPFHVHQFCVDYGKHNGKDDLVVYVCTKLPEAKPKNWTNFVFLVLYLVGLASLLATLAVYALLPDLRRSVYAKALMCHAAALAVALLALVVAECISVNTYAACATIAFFVQFYLLASFFWLTVMSFDLTRGLRDQLPINTAKSAGRLLLYYSLFAWSGPVVIVAVTATLNYVRGLPLWVQRPEIGRRTCWFSHTWARFCYYYGPVACLLLANAVMFSYTIIRFRAAQRTRAVLKSKDSCLTGGALRKRKEWLLLYAKLFALMGVSWLLEVVVWAAALGDFTGMLVDAINVLRSVGVFAVCCCKRKVLDALRDRLSGVLPLLDRHRQDNAPSTGTESSNISHRPSPADNMSLKEMEGKDEVKTQR